MKIVLLKDVANLGTAGEVKEVADGYARNYLVPKGFATLATKGLIKQAQERAEAQRKRELKARTDAEALSQRINGQTVRFVARVGELDRLYGSITNVDIAQKLAAQVGFDVDRRRVELGDPIKRAGVYSVVVNLGHGMEPRINVVVEGENAPAEAAAAPAEAEQDAVL
ncbi:MAG: LSU ribosomal protein L9p [uncultured Chloroflexia bacterium]|uniref:Large ribosomal subunit protein bL9 n=1 Tax=uncultured Chloroflexia bacterium TaxID=1672391 RepID=A0A6J4JNT0_9CHLR|nr:MAG: LSU ribosomal protein L9p [uncultured Chloroflexia bacterium]